MEELSAGLPAVQALQACIPGVGPVLSATIVAETGPIERIHSPKALARYAGLTPSERSSGGQQRNGAITKEGSAQLRWALVQAEMGARRCRKGPGPYPLSQLAELDDALTKELDRGHVVLGLHRLAHEAETLHGREHELDGLAQGETL